MHRQINNYLRELGLSHNEKIHMILVLAFCFMICLGFFLKIVWF
ncbi:MAG: hypothetical protein AAF655_03205 [Bacteroidota bacterium]